MGYREGDTIYDAGEGKIMQSTPKAYLVDFTVVGECWVPKSQIVKMSGADPNGNIQFVVTDWWASKQGWYERDRVFR